MKLGNINLGDLGRNAAKVENLTATLDALSVEAAKLKFELNKYGPQTAKLHSGRSFSGYRQRDPETRVVGTHKGPPLEVARDIQASRLSFKGRPCFDPRPLYDD